MGDTPFREAVSLPPQDVADRAQLVRLPLKSAVVSRIQQAAARRRRPLDTLGLAHELGDFRFVAAFAPDGANRPRWQTALSSFVLISGERPALMGHTVHALDTLRSIRLPDGWDEDPIEWEQAEATSLSQRLQRRSGRTVPFTVECSPHLRVVDPTKAPQGRRRNPRMREVDIARHMQAKNPDLTRAEAYGAWLSEQVQGAVVEAQSIRVMDESNQEVGNRNYQQIGIRLVGRLTVTDCSSLAQSLVRGIGRRRAYGLGMLALG